MVVWHDQSGNGNDASGTADLRALGPVRRRLSVLGTDASQLSAFSTDVPPPFERRLQPTWAWTLTDGGNGDGVGVVTLRFRVGGLFVSQRASDFALLCDDDGAFLDARVLASRAAFDAVLQAVELRNVELGPERYFTLAIKTQ